LEYFLCWKQLIYLFCSVASPYFALGSGRYPGEVRRNRVRGHLPAVWLKAWHYFIWGRELIVSAVNRVYIGLEYWLHCSHAASCLGRCKSWIRLYAGHRDHHFPRQSLLRRCNYIILGESTPVNFFLPVDDINV
jgi:hypothetical protein